MNFQSLVRAIQRYILVFLSIILVFVAIGVSLNFYMPPMYRAKSSLISNSLPDDQRDSRYTSIMANQLLTKTYESVIDSLLIAGEVKAKTNSSLSPSQLQELVKVKTEPTNLTIEISVTMYNRKDAEAIVNAYALTVVERVKDIIMNANLTLLDLATDESTSVPVSPKKELNIAVCTLIGFMIALSIVMLLDSRRKAKSTRTASGKVYTNETKDELRLRSSTQNS